MKYSLRWQWLGLALALLALTLWLSPAQRLSRSNLWLQDLGSAFQRTPASQEVVLVEADERSLAQIGRWPWRRALHAHVLQHISQGQPQSITLDILLTEADWDYPQDDLLLAAAMAQSGRVILPAAGAADAPQPLLPLPLFAQAAQRLGHIHMPLDDDGGVRRFYAYERVGDTTWPHLGLPTGCAGTAQHDCAPDAASHTAAAAPVRGGLTHIRFASPTPGFVRYSYLDVLRNQIPAAAFKNKHVLIGTAATGLGSVFATPNAPGNVAMHSTELLAHIASGALQGKHAAIASTQSNALFNVLPVALALLALYFCGPSVALLCCAALGVATVVACMLATALWHTVFAPAAALLGLVLAYPLWSWRRLHTAAQLLQQSMQELQRQGFAMAPAPRPGDFLHNRIEAVEQASQQLRQLQTLVTETLLQLPSPTLACDAQGCILLANSAAHRYARQLERTLRPQQPIAELLQGAVQRDSTTPLWDAKQLPPLTQSLQCEGVDVQQRNLLLLSQPFTVQGQQGYLVSLVDISELRQAMAQRDQAMHFISHDIRAPIGGIVTLLEMERHFQSSAQPAPSAHLLERIERYARSSLALADDFVHLARAQHATLQPSAQLLGVLIDQALDDNWAAARARQVRLQWLAPDEEAWVLGDASMLRRACSNLVSNAIKYGPEQGTVFCDLYLQGDSWCIAIRDQGDGIPAAARATLFDPFNRLAQHANRTPGAGLGLAYVMAVARQHGGTIELEDRAQGGTCFVLRLPRWQTADHEAANA